MPVELQEKPVTAEGQVTKPIQSIGTEPFGDEGISASLAESQLSGLKPSGEVTVDGSSVPPTSEGLWSTPTQPEAQVANQGEATEPVTATPVVSEAPKSPVTDSETVSIDSAFMATDSPLAREQADAMQADRILQKDIAQTEQSLGMAQEAPTRTPEPQMPEFHAQANDELEKGIAEAEERFDQTLARLEKQRDELRERAAQVDAEIRNGKLQEKERLSAELAERISARERAVKEHNDGIQDLNEQLAKIEQTLSETQ